MPTPATTVGLQTIPVPTAGAGSPIEDRPVVVLMDYLGFWLRYSLNDKLAELGGNSDTTDEEYEDACPAANLFPYDPKDVWPRNPKPALYVWWSGESKEIAKTLVYDLRERVLSFVWVYCQIVSPDVGAARGGLTALVDATIRRAKHRGRHPEWSYGDFPAGSLVTRAAGLHDWKITRTEPGVFAPVVETTGGGHEQSFYPVVRGTITIWERVYDDQPVVPDDLNTDPKITIATQEEPSPAGPLDLYELYIPGPPFGGG